MHFQDIIVHPIAKSETFMFQKLMQDYHYLGALPKIGNTIQYVAAYNGNWLALIVFSAAALKCGARDKWIGWDCRHQYDRLNLLANNSRFLILPEYHYKNLASKVLSLCLNRIQSDWISFFGYPLLLVETFVDPTRFYGTVYKASNWHFIGYSKGFQRIRGGYSNKKNSGKMVFVFPLQRNAIKILACPILPKVYRSGGAKMKLKADHMRSLPDFFKTIEDPRREQGLRHRLEAVLAIAAAAVLCGMDGYKAISDWAKGLSQKARERFGCRYYKQKYIVPSESTFRDVLVRVNPVQLDGSLQQWNEVYGIKDESLAIDGKTMRNAIDENGRKIHIMSAIGHESSQCYTQKK
jgi:hypothetical protein